MRPAILRALLDELPLKLLAFGIAVTLFAIVRSDKDAAAGAYVRVQYQLPDDRVLMSEPVGEVRVGVRGPWTRLQRFDEREVEPIRVDLRQHSDPELRFDESMVKLPVGLRASSISPSQIKLQFEPRVTRAVPVQPQVEGEPAPGYHVARVAAHPTTVLVDGARSAVEGLAHVMTRPLPVVGARRSVRGEVALAPAPPHARYVDATTVEVEADVGPAMVERTFEALPIKLIGLTRLDGIVEPPSARLILRGPADLLDGVSSETVALQIEAQLIDLRPPARYLRTVTVGGLPAGIAAEVQPDSVAVTTHRR